MAKRKPKFIEPPDQDPEEQARLEQEQFLQEAPPAPAEVQSEQYIDEGIQKVFRVLKGLNLSGGKVGIFLKRSNTLKAGYVGEMPLEQFQMDGFETLKRLYGGGDYMLQFKDGQGVIVTQAPLMIDPRFKGEIDAPERQLAPEKPDTEDRLAQLVEKLKPAAQDNNSMTQILVAMIDSNQKTLTAMMSAIATMNSRPAPPPPPPTDAIVLPVLLEMIRAKTDKTPLVETIEAMAVLKSMQEGAEPRDDMVEKLIKTMGPTLLNILARQQQQPQPMPATVAVEATRAIAGEAPAASGAAGANGATAPAPGQEPKLTAFIPMLLNAARKGTPPAAYYEVICDNVPDDQLDKLIEELLTPGWFESLFGTHPDVIAQKPWLEKLRAVFLDADEAEEAAAAGKEAKA
jgi:hypothetical protein